MENEIISKQDAIKLGLKQYYTGKLCKRNHRDFRSTCNSECLACVRERYHQNIEKQRLRSRKYYKNNTDRESLRKQIAYKFDKEKFDKRNEIWRKGNSGHACHITRKGQLRERLLNTDKYDKEILSYYLESQRITEETGIPHEVDHIVPLNGKNVSGLHVPWNLQVITKADNRTKFNKLINPT